MQADRQTSRHIDMLTGSDCNTVLCTHTIPQTTVVVYILVLMRDLLLFIKNQQEDASTHKSTKSTHAGTTFVSCYLDF